MNEVDETACLLQPEVNKDRLLKAVENVEKKENLVEVQIGDLQ